MADRPASVLESLLFELDELERLTLCLASSVAFRRMDDEDDELITTLRPTTLQERKATANHKRLLRWTAAVSGILRRRGSSFTTDFEELSKELARYVLLDRSDIADVTEGLWRRAFNEETRGLVAQLREILDESVDAFVVLEMQQPLQYDLLEVCIRQLDAGQWSVRAVGPTGEQAEAVFTPPLTEIMHATRQYIERRMPPDLPPTIAFGHLLFTTVVKNDVAVLFERMRDDAINRQAGLRIHLQTKDAGSLGEVPWELLHDGKQFLCLSARTPVTRNIPGPVRAARSASRPLRLLVTISAPKRMPALDVAHEQELLQDALAPLIGVGRVQLDIARDGSMNTLRRLLNTAEYEHRPYDAWHFIGHGSAGALAMEGEAREAWYAGAFDLEALFNEYPRLRLVVLNACEGARVAGSSAAAAFIGCGVPSVVAMQFRISDRSAIAFAEEFYGALVDSGSVDIAMAEARRAIYFLPNYTEWFTPVLYQCGEERLFEASTRASEQD